MFVNTAVANAQSYDWRTWGLGIMRSFISGGSAAIVSGLTSMGIDSNQFNLTTQKGHTFEMMGIMFLVQGGYRMFEFLSLHSIPDPVTVNAPSAKSVNVTIPTDGSGVSVQQDKK